MFAGFVLFARLGVHAGMVEQADSGLRTGLHDLLADDFATS